MKYLDAKGKEQEINLDEKQKKLVEEAKKNYETSLGYVRKNHYDIWRSAIKSYELSTADRKAALGKDSWKQNISIGLVRSFTDVMVSAVNEKPLVFVGTGLTKQGIENKEKILKTLNFISDRSKFHKQLKKTMRSGLQYGTICMRVGYMKTNSTEKISSIVGDMVITEEVELEKKNFPYAVNVSPFNVFPDPYEGNLRYVTERDVVDYENFIETFGHMIRSKFNESPFKDDEFLSLLPTNRNDAVFDDYGNILNQIREKYNDECKTSDSFSDNKTTKTFGTATSYDEDVNVTEGLIEFKITWYKSRCILFANNYPVYIGKNIYGFIPYVISSSNSLETRYGAGIPYMLKPIEDVANSFINNYFDSARAIANPTLVVNKNLMINDEELEDGTPGGILYTENNDGGNAVYRLDKGALNDFNILPMIIEIAQQLTGISEYNLGVAARERTASGALAVTQSSQKRLSPYISTFLDSISVIAGMWLSMVKKYWTTEEFIYFMDEDGNQSEEMIKNADLVGGIDVSLEAEGMFGSFEELELQKLISTYQILAPSGFIQSPELAKEIIRKSGFNPSKFIAEPGEGTIPENMKQKNPEGVPEEGSPEVNPLEDMGNVEADYPEPKEGALSDMLKSIASPQLDLGNQGQGNK